MTTRRIVRTGTMRAGRCEIAAVRVASASSGGRQEDHSPNEWCGRRAEKLASSVLDVLLLRVVEIREERGRVGQPETPRDQVVDGEIGEGDFEALDLHRMKPGQFDD